jgi:hypothetical protein
MSMFLSVVAGQGGIAPCGAPGTLSLANGSDTATQINLSWSAPSDTGGGTVSGYHIQISTNGSSWSDQVADTGSTGTTYTASSLSGTTQYWFRVAAINEAGTGTYGNEPTHTTAAPFGYSTTGSPTVRTVGSYTTLEYTGSGTFVLTGNPASKTFDLLVVAGGASGNSGYMTVTSSMHGGGGGGAGGMRAVTGQTLSVASHTVTVFAGGAAPAFGVSSWGADGSGGTAITGHTVVGGGLGENSTYYGSNVGPNVGGSGGGGGPTEFGGTPAGAAGTAGEGNAGGSGYGYYLYRWATGGGGGKGGVGQNSTHATDSGYAGDGGAASSNDYATGSGIDYSGGGGGGSYYYDFVPVSTVGGQGGANAGRGGSGYRYPNNIGPGINATSATANRGGGGGGGGYDAYSQGYTSGNGGSGTVVIRWLT